MIQALVIVHGLMAMLLVGAVSHQALSVLRLHPSPPPPQRSFVESFRAVRGNAYTNAVVVLYVMTFALGAYIYPHFVLNVKSALIEFSQNATIGVFQIKEHVAVIGLATLPAYWHFWKQVPADTQGATRRILTTMLAAMVWWNLVIGHFLNNVKGLT